MSLSGIAKFILGFIVGIILLAVGGGATGYYFFTKMSANPPKPIFAEEQQRKLPAVKKVSTAIPSSRSPSSKPTPSESPVREELPPGAYKARVSWSEGLSLRDSPSQDSNRIGGVAFNQEIIVLKESDDKRWQQIRLADGEQEGWIKAGNIERTE